MKCAVSKNYLVMLFHVHTVVLPYQEQLAATTCIAGTVEILSATTVARHYIETTQDILF
jgi:hypothetical protein